MSDHYDYVIHCEFSHTLPQQLVETLRYMVRREDYAFDTPPDHPFFEPDDCGNAGVYEAWRDILCLDPSEDTGYFARFFQFTSPRYAWGPGFGAPYILEFRLDVHEDEEGNVWRLLQWLATVSTTRGFVGYALLQDGGFSHPTLWYFMDGDVVQYGVTVEQGAPDIVPPDIADGGLPQLVYRRALSPDS